MGWKARAFGAEVVHSQAWLPGRVVRPGRLGIQPANLFPIMRKKPIPLLVALAAVLGGAPTLAQQIRFEEFKLDNGLHVILHENHTAPIVAVTVMYHVGSKDESPERTGMAHFFEHLLFEGSEHIGRGEFSAYVEKAGGELNANTTSDRTFYYEILPSNQLELGLWLESERMMHAKIEPVGIETQREVVKEEKRQRYDNTPYGTLWPEIHQRAYSDHPYRWTPIGSMEHIDAASFEDFMDFYHQFYTPDNAVLSIAGDIDPAQTRALVEAYFGGIPAATRRPSRPSAQAAPLPGELRDTVYDHVRLPAMVQAYRIPERTHPDFPAVDLLTRLLSRGESSRLYRGLVDEQRLALTVSSFAMGTEHPGLALSFALPNMGVGLEQLEQAMEREFERARQELVSPEELQKLRNQVETQFLGADQGVAYVAEQLANYHTFHGSAALVNQQMDKYMAVTP